jgi:hypothetical protein
MRDDSAMVCIPFAQFQFGSCESVALLHVTAMQRERELT